MSAFRLGFTHGRRSWPIDRRVRVHTHREAQRADRQLILMADFNVAHDLPPVHEGAVRALEIMNEDFVFPDQNRAMPFADQGARRSELALRVTPDKKGKSPDRDFLSLRLAFR